MAQAETLFLNPNDSHQGPAASALAAGEVHQLGDSRACYAEGLEAIASGDPVSQRVRAVARFASASATTFSKGDPVYWDASANQAIGPSATVLDGSADFYLGTASKAKTSGQTEVEVDMNAQPLLPAMPLPFIREFDTEDGQDETAAVKNIWHLIPANQNKRGFIILGVYGLVTEVFGGAGQDQGIVTVTDGDGNTIATLTPTDGGADAVNDVIIGTNKALGGTTGDAIKVVAAGKAVRGQVTQETSGAGAAGKMKVIVLAVPLV